MRDVIVGYWPLWYPVAAATALVVLACAWSRFVRRYKRRIARARFALSEHDIARAGRPSPAPIDVEPRR